MKRKITNYKLRNFIEDRGRFDIIDDFECFMCRIAANEVDGQVYKNKIKIASRKDYDCKDTALNYPRMLDHEDNENVMTNRELLWKDSVKQGKCEATVIHDFMLKNVKFTNSEYFEKFMITISNNVEC